MYDKWENRVYDRRTMLSLLDCVQITELNIFLFRAHLGLTSETPPSSYKTASSCINATQDPKTQIMPYLNGKSMLELLIIPKSPLGITKNAARGPMNII